MSMFKLRLPSPALVIAMVALLLVLGGTAVAASTSAPLTKAAVTKIVKHLAPSLSVKHAQDTDHAVNADALGGVAASGYVRGPVEAVHAVGTNGNPAFATNWANNGTDFQATDFYKDPFGIVHLEGDLKHTGNVNGEIVFTLPVGYRPTKAERYAVQGNGDGSTATLKINADGTVVMWGVSVSGATYTLNGVTFRP